MIAIYVCNGQPLTVRRILPPEAIQSRRGWRLQRPVLASSPALHFHNTCPYCSPDRASCITVSGSGSSFDVDMSLRDTLFQSIATLDRIAPSDAERGQPYYSDEKVPVHDSLEHHRFPHAWTDDEKFIRLSTSSASLRYLRRSRSVPSIQPSLLSREADYSKMESHGEPKITWRHAAQVSRHILTVAFSFLSIGAAIAIIGLAADNINWGTGRGSQDANTVTAVIIGEYEVGRGYLERWVTKMLYL